MMIISAFKGTLERHWQIFFINIIIIFLFHAFARLLIAVQVFNGHSIFRSDVFRHQLGLFSFYKMNSKTDLVNLMPMH